MEHGTDRFAGGYLVQIQDITQRKLVEQEKKELQTQRMKSISTLAGGIAHDFNNALSGITINLDLLKMDLPNMASINQYLESMNNAAQRMVNLTDQLLAYARGGKYYPKTISLSKFVEKTLPMILNKFDSVIHVETNLSGDISNIKADITQMYMVLSAVVTNAAEAIQGRGRIIITTETKEVEEGFAKYRPGLTPGRYVCLMVQDDGTGMDTETRDKIFEPFFTRKFQGRGLGMAAVYGIVKNHGGWISVDSRLGKGTVVRIYFPVVQTPSKQSEKAHAEPEKVTGVSLLNQI
jgi:signal transduction histidine kinase